MNKKILGITLVLALLSAGIVSAYGFGGGNNLDSAEQAAFQENREERMALMQDARQAVIDGDYSTWASLVEQLGGPLSEDMLSTINEGNFSKLQELYQLEEQARSLRDELGIGFHGMGGPGHKGFGHRGAFSDTPLQDEQA